MFQTWSVFQALQLIYSHVHRHATRLSNSTLWDGVYFPLYPSLPTSDYPMPGTSNREAKQIKRQVSCKCVSSPSARAWVEYSKVYLTKEKPWTRRRKLLAACINDTEIRTCQSLGLGEGHSRLGEGERRGTLFRCRQPRSGCDARKRRCIGTRRGRDP